MLHTLQSKTFILRLNAGRFIKPLCLTAAMFLCMRAELLLRASPLAAALMAGALTSGAHPAPLVVGCLLGMLRFPLTEISLLPAISCVLALALELVLSLLPLKRRPTPETKASLLAGLCVLLPALISANGALLPSLQALSCALLAASCAPFFMAAAALHPGRKQLMFQEKLGLALLACAALTGAWHMLPPAGEFLAGLLVLLLPGGVAIAHRWAHPVPICPPLRPGPHRPGGEQRCAPQAAGPR